MSNEFDSFPNLREEGTLSPDKIVSAFLKNELTKAQYGHVILATINERIFRLTTHWRKQDEAHRSLSKK